MLVIRREAGQAVDVTHRSGDVLRIRVVPGRSGRPDDFELIFDDDDRHFAIERTERRPRPRRRRLARRPIPAPTV